MEEKGPLPDTLKRSASTCRRFLSVLIFNNAKGKDLPCFNGAGRYVQQDAAIYGGITK